MEYFVFFIFILIIFLSRHYLFILVKYFYDNKGVNMKKIIFKGVFLFYLLFFSVSVRAIDTYSHNAVMYNLNDDEVIFEKNKDERVKIASLTKIMTAIITLENVDDIHGVVEMPREAFEDLDGYATSGISVGDIVTYEDLLYGIMLPSGADCANALAISVAGSIDNFVSMMNVKARDLGMNDTFFSNPIGKDLDNYSTVSDVAIMLKYALNNEEFYKLFTTRNYVTTTNLRLESTLTERARRYNLDISNILGSKTGFTDEAGYCLASLASINGVSYLLVTVKAGTSMPYQLMDAINLYDYFSSNYGYKRVLEFGSPLVTLRVGLFKRSLSISSDSDVFLYLNNDVFVDDITYDYVGVTDVGSVSNGEYLGKIKINYHGDLLYEYDVFSDRSMNDNWIIVGVFFILMLTVFYMVVRNRKKFNLQI